MAFNNPFSKLYEAIMARLEAQVPAIKYISLNLGQLENYNYAAGNKPSVTFPCTLIDFVGYQFTDRLELVQDGDGYVELRTAYSSYTDLSNIKSPAARAIGLKFLELEWDIVKALHGWSPGEEYGYLMRVNQDTEKRTDPLRVRDIRFKLGFEDYSLKPAQATTPKANIPLDVTDSKFVQKIEEPEE